MGSVVARVCRHGCDRRGIGVRYGTGQPQTDNRPRALSRFLSPARLSCTTGAQLVPRAYARARPHIYTFVPPRRRKSSPFSRWTRANKRTPGTRQCKIQDRVPRATRQPRRRRRRFVSASLRRRIAFDRIAVFFSFRGKTTAQEEYARRFLYLT